MEAVVIHETGGPDVLRLEEMDQPEPGEGEVLVRVHAASVNPVDWKQRRSETTLPAVLGRDVSGKVETSRSSALSDGDEVFGTVRSGGYAEFATAAVETLARKPEGVSHEQAAAIPVAGVTAWQGLFDHGGLSAGQTALIAGGAGGVGHFAVQFAHNASARVIATGSSRNRDFVLSLGADEYVDYNERDVAQAVVDVDVVLDTVGGETTESLVPTLAEDAILVTIAAAPPEEAARERRARAEVFRASVNTDQLTRIAEQVAAGEVRVELAEVLPLADIRHAHELSESGHTRGKIVLSLET